METRRVASPHSQARFFLAFACVPPPPVARSDAPSAASDLRGIFNGGTCTSMHTDAKSNYQTGNMLDSFSVILSRANNLIVIVIITSNHDHTFTLPLPP